MSKIGGELIGWELRFVLFEILAKNITDELGTVHVPLISDGIEHGQK